MMILFKYNPFYKFFYRYGNFVVTIMFALHSLSLVYALPENWKMIFPLLIYVLIVFVIHRFYFKLYKKMPFKIFVDNEKIIFDDFFKLKQVEVKISDIKNLDGNIFSGRLLKPLRIQFDDQEILVYPYLKDFNNFIKILLSNIEKELYEDLLEKLRPKKTRLNNRAK